MQVIPACVLGFRYIPKHTRTYEPERFSEIYLNLNPNFFSEKMPKYPDRNLPVSFSELAAVANGQIASTCLSKPSDMTSGRTCNFDSYVFCSFLQLIFVFGSIFTSILSGSIFIALPQMQKWYTYRQGPGDDFEGDGVGSPGPVILDATHPDANLDSENCCEV